jgi:membrane protease YdiL (CAAX protease family)
MGANVSSEEEIPVNEEATKKTYIPPPPPQQTKSDTSEDSKRSGKIWQMILIAVITYMLWIITTCLGTFIAFKGNFAKPGQASGAKGGALLLLFSSILMPIIYGVFVHLKSKDNGSQDPNAPKVSKDSVLIIIILSFLLLIISSSFGIWMNNASDAWKTNDEENGVQIYFIIILVLAIVLPFLYGVFYFRKEICERFVKDDTMKV